MFLWNFRRGGLAILFLSLIVVFGCGGSREESPTTLATAPGRPPAEAPPPESEAGQTLVPSSTSLAPEEPHGSLSSALSLRASVLAGKALGMVITGKGAEESARSLDVLEQQVLSFLPQLQEVYDQEREQDPNLMGSLDASMTIAPGGGVSDLRFPLRRVSSEKLIATVFDRMRAWGFPPADKEVQLRFRLLFVPPGVDQASILTWEKQLGSHALADHSGESRVATAASPAPAKKVFPRISSPVSPTSRTAEATRVPVTGWYRVVSPTMLRAAPRDSAEVVTRLRPGTQVRVVGLVDGEWLEVRSVSNRPPGFLPR
ncbi:MAG TPA: SH3 domain-containing protein, partial [Candidatus Binatia bacterium]|nr:SH3 domain-containing protein [Candidatus Binatia bacterium]